MFKTSCFIFVCYLLAVNCQIHYVPAQILIPTLNVTHFNVTNHTQTGGGFNSIQYPQNPQYPTVNNNNVNNNKSIWQWNQTTANGDLIVGQIGYLDRLLFNQEYFKARRWWGSRDKIIEYPRDLPGSYGRHEIITAIRCYNKFYDGISATAKILKGGIGQRYAQIKIESSWGKGFKYLVQIYGK